MKIFIKDNISHYFLRRDLLPAQELLEEQHDGVMLRCQAAHENQILPLLFYWLPNIQIPEPARLKEKLVKTLEGYGGERSHGNRVICITLFLPLAASLNHSPPL